MSSDDLENDLAALAENIEAILSESCERRLVHGYFDGENELDTTLWSLASELGWLGIGLPEEFGGLGMGARGLDVLYRALGRMIAPGAFIPTLPAAQWLSETASSETKTELLTDVAAGRCTFAVPLSLDSEHLELSGGKVSGQTPLMLLSRAASIAVVAVTSAGSKGLALVDLRDPATAPIPADIWDRSRLVGRYDLRGAKVIAVLDDTDGAAANSLRRHLALAIAGDCVGSAAAITEQTIAYLKERVQFGRALASMQALKHRVADLMTIVVHSQEMLDQAVSASAEADPSADMWAQLAKASAADNFKFVAEDCVQLHGGVGFTWEFDCHIFVKRALLNREIAGNSALLRDLAAAHFSETIKAGRSTAELTL